MINKSCVDRHGKAILERLPFWLPYVLGIYTITLFVNSLSGTGDVRSSNTVASVYAWYAACCFNLTLAGVGVYSIVRTCLGLWENWNESKRFIERVWKIAQQVRTGNIDTVSILVHRVSGLLDLLDRTSDSRTSTVSTLAGHVAAQSFI